MASVSHSVFPLFEQKNKQQWHTHRYTQLKGDGERVKKEPYQRLYNTVDSSIHKYITGWEAIEISKIELFCVSLSPTFSLFHSDFCTMFMLMALDRSEVTIYV